MCDEIAQGVRDIMYRIRQAAYSPLPTGTAAALPQLHHDLWQLLDPTMRDTRAVYAGTPDALEEGAADAG